MKKNPQSCEYLPFPTLPLEQYIFLLFNFQKFNDAGNGANQGELIHTSLGGVGVVPGDEAV